MYGSENWSLNKCEKRKTETKEMCFLKSLSGYTLIDRMQYDINRWHNHISRMTQKVKNCGRIVSETEWA